MGLLRKIYDRMQSVFEPPSGQVITHPLAELFQAVMVR